MPFQTVLSKLLDDAEESIAVLFLDENGEAVDVACSEMNPNDMKIVGAYMSIYLRQVDRVLQTDRFGETGLLHIESPNLHIYARPLPEGYFLVLVQRSPALVGKAKLGLGIAAESLSQEIFSNAD